MLEGIIKQVAKTVVPFTQWFSSCVCLKISIIIVKPEQMKISNKNTLQVTVDKLIRSFLNLQKYMSFCNYLQTSPIGHTKYLKEKLF